MTSILGVSNSTLEPSTTNATVISPTTNSNLKPLTTYSNLSSDEVQSALYITCSLKTVFQKLVLAEAATTERKDRQDMELLALQIVVGKLPTKRGYVSHKLYNTHLPTC